MEMGDILFFALLLVLSITLPLGYYLIVKRGEIIERQKRELARLRARLFEVESSTYVIVDRHANYNTLQGAVSDAWKSVKKKREQHKKENLVLKMPKKKRSTSKIKGKKWTST